MNNTSSTQVNESPHIETKPARTVIRPVRKMADTIYNYIIGWTSFIENSTPHKEPTESQKFRANMLVAFIGSLVFGFAILVIQDGFRRSEEAAKSESMRLGFLHEELKEFSTAMPAAVLNTYDVARMSSLYSTKGLKATDDEMEPMTKLTWAQIYEYYEDSKGKLYSNPQSDVLCRRLQIFLKHSSARDAVEQLRQHTEELLSFEHIHGEDTLRMLRRCDEKLALVNNAWENAMKALADEFNN